MQDLKMEEWKDVKDFEGIYEVSNLGRVRNIVRQNILRPQLSSHGYIQVNLYNQGKGKTQKVHRLVAQAFLDNPENKPQVNHIDCNKQNNKVTNLEWCTAKENSVHAKEHKLQTHVRGTQVPQSKLNDCSVKEIKNKLKEGISEKELSMVYGVHRVTILDIKKGKTWKHIE